MDAVSLLLIAGLVFGFSLVAKRIEPGLVTPPMIFVVAGMLLAWSPWFAGISTPLIESLLEVTLALVLFSDAARVDLQVVRDRLHIPVRLLVIGLPLTIGLGLLIGRPMLGSWGAAALCAVMLAPTDAALGEAVVSDKRVPVFVRQSLSVESGLNDGLAVPALTAAIAFAVSMETGADGVAPALASIVIGVTVGIVAGRMGAAALIGSTRRGWSDVMGTRIGTLGLALATFAAAETLLASGFVAVFVAGMVLGSRARELCSTLFAFTDNEGRLLTLLSFLAFGAVAVPVALGNLTWPIVGYAVLSLTVIRAVPVAISLIGSKLRMVTVAMIAWFGPRGIASVVFVLLAAEALHEEAALSELTLTVVSFTVLLSIVLHGVSAAPLAAAYAAALADATPDMPELTDMVEMDEGTE